MFRKGKSLLYRADFKGNPDSARYEFPKEHTPSVGHLLYHHTGDIRGLHNIVNEARLLYQVTKWSKSNLKKFSSDCLIRGYKILKAKPTKASLENLQNIIEFLQNPIHQYDFNMSVGHLNDEEFLAWSESHSKREILINLIGQSQKQFTDEWWHLLGGAKKSVYDYDHLSHFEAVKSIRLAIALNNLRNEKGYDYLNKEITEKENPYIISIMNIELEWQAEHIAFILGE